MSLTKFAALLLAGGICATGAAAGAADYTYTLIMVPGAKQTDPGGINNKGDVVGYWEDSHYVAHGWLYHGGKLSTFNVPGAATTTPRGIDDQGDIVGSYQDANYNNHGFILSSKGVYTTIDAPDSLFTALTGVSANGTAIGSTENASYVSSVFTYRNGVFTTITDVNTPSPAGVNNSGSATGFYAPPGTDETSFVSINGVLTTIASPSDVYFTQAYAINDNNVVVGQIATDNRDQYGFVYAGGTFQQLGAPGSTDSFALGINDAGAIVGVAFDSDYNSAGYVYQKGAFTRLTIPGDNSVGATAINNAGQVIGDFDTASFVGGTFIATPAP
jgi:uncharacterized membrane protein